MNTPCVTLVCVGFFLVVGAPCLRADRDPSAGEIAVIKTFGPYEALVMDSSIVADVKVDEKGEIYLLLHPEHTGMQITIRNSMQKGPPYRKWFNGQEEWVAMQNTGGRKPGVWSDRLQTSANYIEYWAKGKCFLHLKKIGS